MAHVDHSRHSRLLVIGGAERHGPGGTGILRRFVDLAGGPAADLIVIATASGEPAVLEAEYATLFTRLGAGRVRALRLDTRSQANDPAGSRRSPAATGVFFTGGDQVRITTVLGGTRTDSALHRRSPAGAIVLGGTSAGAAMMSGTMILGGDARRCRRRQRAHRARPRVPARRADRHALRRARPAQPAARRRRAVPARARPRHRRGHRDPRRRRPCSRCSARGVGHRGRRRAAPPTSGSRPTGRSPWPARGSTCCPPGSRFDLTAAGRRPSTPDRRGTGTSRMKIHEHPPPARAERVPVPPGRRRAARLDELTGRETTDVTGFTERLLRALPGLAEHHCAAGAPGGFVEPAARRHLLRPRHRARRASSCPSCIGRDVNFGRTVSAGEPGSTT